MTGTVDPQPSTWRVVVMGVSGSGKTTLGSALATALGVDFVDGDSLHPAANVEKMAGGAPLGDDDRWPWLARVRATLRQEGGAVVACSALARRYRDLLRQADGVRFVLLDVPADEAVRRLEQRPGHFMGPAMVASQFADLERPGEAEVDVATIDAVGRVDLLVEEAQRALTATRPPGTPLVAVGGATDEIDARDLDSHLASVVDLALERRAQRVLLVPPDHTRLHSRAGDIAVRLMRALEDVGREVAILPALGTHVPLGDEEAQLLFGDAVPAGRLLVHDWRRSVRLGEISGDEVACVTGDRYAEPLPVDVGEQLLTGWDLVVSIGQVVPHEVIGMANYTKNLMIGLGGAPTIHRTHFVGAVCDMETIMGRASSPVRDLVDTAFDRFLAPLVDVVFVLTVVEDVGDRSVLRGLFAGEGGSGRGGGAAYRIAAELAQQVNIVRVDPPWPRVACWLDPREMRSTWLGNKAVYRTRMAIADGGDLLVLAPGVERFGEDDEIDALIRRHGYRGTDHVLRAMATDPALADNPAAAAHLVHGSSEGRFTITYCTDPDAGGLTEDEVTAVGYGWRHLGEALASLGVGGDTPSGTRVEAAGEPFTFLRNPAAGLWMSAP